MTIFLPLLLPLVSRAARQLCRCVVAAAAVPNVKPPPTELTNSGAQTRQVSSTEIKRISINMMKHIVLDEMQCSYDRESHHNRKTGYFEILEHEGDRRGGAN